MDSSQFSSNNSIFHQMENIRIANEVLKLQSVKSHPNYTKLLDNYNKGVTTVFNNFAKMEKMEII